MHLNCLEIQLHMSIIKFPLLFEGSKGEKHLYSLFDSGANLSCINPGYLTGLEKPVLLPVPQRMATAADDIYVVKQRVTLSFYIDGVMLSDEFLVIPGLREEAIIGAATMQKWRIKLDFEHDAVHVDPEKAKWRI